MMTKMTQEFFQWLNERRAAIESELRHASDHNRVLLKTERSELDRVIAAYKRIVMKESQGT